MKKTIRAVGLGAAGLAALGQLVVGPALPVASAEAGESSAQQTRMPRGDTIVLNARNTQYEGFSYASFIPNGVYPSAFFTNWLEAERHGAAVSYLRNSQQLRIESGASAGSCLGVGVLGGGTVPSIKNAVVPMSCGSPDTRWSFEDGGVRFQDGRFIDRMTVKIATVDGQTRLTWGLTVGTGAPARMVVAPPGSP